MRCRRGESRIQPEDDSLRQTKRSHKSGTGFGLWAEAKPEAQ